jgi:hypothetical protein
LSGHATQTLAPDADANVPATHGFDTPATAKLPADALTQVAAEVAEVATENLPLGHWVGVTAPRGQ